MKLIVIDDKIEITKLIQRQFERINSGFNKDEVYCLQEHKGKIRFQKIADNVNLQDVPLNHESASSLSQKLVRQLRKFQNESVFVLVDMSLKSDYIGNYNVEDYYEKNEISADIYINLIKIRNKEPDKFSKLFFAVYSRAETFLEVFSTVLKKKYEFLKATNIKALNDFPYESCETNNISWFINYWKDNGNNRQEDDHFPLALNAETINFIKRLK